MFEKVNRSLKYDSNIFFVHKHIYIYQDTTTDHFTPLALRVRGKNYIHYIHINQEDNLAVTKNIKLCLSILADGWSTSGAQGVSAH